MTLDDIAKKNVVIWGTGREGLAAAALLHRVNPACRLSFVDDNRNQSPDICAGYGPLATADAMVSVLNAADVVVKSPGISLYDPRVEALAARGVIVTSLINLWFLQKRRGKTICVTGTKGKSTVSSLIAHMLKALGKRVVLQGNIGHAMDAEINDAIDFYVIEMSSYQTANFDGMCDVAVLTSLFPEHLDWHRSLDQYYRDKKNVLNHARMLVLGDDVPPLSPEKMEANAYLARAHNRHNVAIAAAVLRLLGCDDAQALSMLGDFQGLPHRQQELGEKDGVLYVDDSISTTPQSAMAALAHYQGRPVTLIAGGHDRGIDYTPLVEAVLSADVSGVVCMGVSGKKIFTALQACGYSRAVFVDGMQDAVAHAKTMTPSGGVILLSPAAPSYGMFKDFIERGLAFQREV